MVTSTKPPERRALRSEQGGEIDDGAELLARMADGEEAALGLLIDRFGGRVTGFALRYLGDRAEADDVAQDVFLTAWRRARDFDPVKGRARAWLFTIARNRAVDRLRRRRLGWLVGLDALTGEPEADAPGAVQSVVARSELAAAKREIEALPDRQRLALLLATVGDLDTTEIAQTMGLSRGAVEQLLVRARRRLRTKLGREEGKTAS